MNEEIKIERKLSVFIAMIHFEKKKNFYSLD